MRSALSAKVLENEIMVMETLELEAIKTKQVTKLMQDLGVEGKIVEVTHEEVQAAADKAQPFMTEIMRTLINDAN